MMHIILDTHAAIWFVTDDNKLSRFSKRTIEDPQNVCFISIATLWEMGIKYSLDKLELKAELKKIFEIFFDSGLSLLSISPDHILTYTTLPYHHRDPFDRLIIAQAKHEGLNIISKDSEFKKYDVNLIWDDNEKKSSDF
jgi:PIN domain nuclease of toxin-antitoxin system